MSKEKSFFSAVIYVHNAESWIERLLESIIRILEMNFEHSEIICVNDYSTDCSVNQIRNIAAKAQSTTVTVVNMSYFHGLEIAMNAGVDLAIGDFVLEIDHPVMNYDPGEIMKAYRKVLEGYDIVSVSAAKKQKLSSRIFYWLYDRFSNGNQRMRSETFHILSRRAINRISSTSKTIPYRKGIYATCGLRTASIEYRVIRTDKIAVHDDRMKRYRGELAVDALLLFTDAGYFFAKMMTGIMSVISLFTIVYTVIIYIMSKPVAGWTTTILFLAVAFLGLFVILTIIIKYLQILLELSFKRTKYNFESIEKISK